MTHKFIEPKAPPISDRSVVGWMRNNLFDSPLNTALTIIIAYVLLQFIPLVLDWALFSATWVADSDACKAGSGACWGLINAKWRFILFGTYTYDEHWRPFVGMLILLGACVGSTIPVFWKPMRLLLLWVVSSVLLGIIMWGGIFGLSYVENTLWGGLPLTLIIAVYGTLFAFPIGILLALGRMSNLPAIKSFCIFFIELIRGVPLISVLFMSSFLLPLFLPDGVNIDKLLRAQVGITLFTAAYLAEVFRGGLQAIPNGQFEAANSLGLTYWQSMRMIILPQALRLVIPPTVNSFISMFKDTSLVVIIGLMDLLGTVKSVIKDPEWRIFYAEGYVFAAAIFFFFCYSMARYSAYLEVELRKGEGH
ncbi:MAG: amino acid ABC transporter permease [Rhodospirillales bacterium]|nr:amino acid ABC transporter permease [Rhodospirillales bacterium]